MNYFNEVRRKIFAYRYLGEKVLQDGAILIGKAPHVGHLAWLHAIYPALNLEEIKALEEQIGRQIPNDYKVFLSSYSNGLYLFSGDLSLDGLRKRMERSSENAWQPFSIITPNTIERLDDAEEQYFFIGGYTWDNGFSIYIDTTTGKVFMCNHKSVVPLYEWPNFENFLTSEVRRLSTLFDDKGRPLNPDTPTTPIVLQLEEDIVVDKSEEMTVVCSHVLSGQRPVLYVCKPDGRWGFTCGDNDHDGDPYPIVKVDKLLAMDSTLQDVLNLPDEWEAEREAVGGTWYFTEGEPIDEEENEG